MATELELETIAEGVESQDQVDFLTELGCNTMQGYFYARPMHIEDYNHILQKHHEGNALSS
ncbi:MAG: EAL domain-containing protein [Raoultibacter sp.]|jgi:EAL domain-containing protein (putative c-di-GMP-specific phosphodiesterase class I)